MNIQYGKQIKLTELKNISIDIFICAENHEERAFTLYDKISENISFGIALCYKESISNNAKQNFSKFFIKEYDQIYSILDTYLNTIHKDDVTILIDYSCMTKSWYYSILLYLKNKNSRFRSILTYFSYTPAKFIEPQEPKPNKDIGPLPGKYIVPTDKAKALIVCLGYEQNKAEGIIEHLDPKEFFLFYTDPASDHNFLTTLKNHNENLLAINQDKAIQYPYNDLATLEQKLTLLYYQLRDKYSIIIAPLGPKPFTFISMVMSVKYPDVDIWRVGSGSDINEYKNEAIDQKSFIICELLFESNNENL